MKETVAVVVVVVVVDTAAKVERGAEVDEVVEGVIGIDDEEEEASNETVVVGGEVDVGIPVVGVGGGTHANPLNRRILLRTQPATTHPLCLAKRV